MRAQSIGLPHPHSIQQVKQALNVVYDIPKILEDATLERIGKALGLSTAAIKNLDEEKAIYNIQNNYEGSHTSNAPYYQYNAQCSFNPLDECRNEVQENRRLVEENVRGATQSRARKDRPA